LDVREALRHPHFLGRHLILDLAEDEDDIERRRAKTKIGFRAGKGLLGQREKLQLGVRSGSDEEVMGCRDRQAMPRVGY
jgi:multiple RNA-binding domain-containing protein 1